MRPASYQDLVDGKRILHKVETIDREVKYLEIIPGTGRFCDTIAGRTYFFGWTWKGYDFGSQGHLPIKRYATEREFMSERQQNCTLFIEE